MSLILCPECGSKISDKALTCPVCGYVSENNSLPISVQDEYKAVPLFKFQVSEWNPQIISTEDNKIIYNYLGDFNNISLKMPALAETIKAMAKEEKIYAAKIPEYIQKLIDKGEYTLMKDSKGEMLATLIDQNKQIVRQFRLEEKILNNQFARSLSNLSNQLTMSNINAEIESLGKQICMLHNEIQNDRLALADSSIQQYRQALLIEDAKKRNIALISIVNKATEAKCKLIRNFELNYKFLEEAKNKNMLEQIFRKDDVESNAKDALSNIVAITNLVQIENAGYAALGEYKAEHECLLEFKEFISKNRLNSRDSLLTINEGLKNKKIEFVNQFEEISNNISNINLIDFSSENNDLKLISGENDEKK